MSIVRAAASDRCGNQAAAARLPAGGAGIADERSPICTVDVGEVAWRVEPRRVLKILLLIIATLVVLGALLPPPFYQLWLGRQSWAADIVGLRFDLNGEGNIPAYFSALQLLACAVALTVIAARSWRARHRWRFHWSLLAVSFFYMSIDEAAQLHELLGVPGVWLADLLGVENRTHAIWIPLALLVVVPVGLAFFPFLLALPRQIAALMVASGTLFVGGAMAFEVVQAGIWDDDFGNLAYFGLVVVEEALEMVAIALFLFTLLLVLAMNVESRRFDVAIDIRGRR
jgi:hypothetical protein